MKLPMITLHACVLVAMICLMGPISFVQARIIAQIVPTLTVTEEYTDNYFQTGSDTFEEWTTSYELGFSFGFLTKKSSVYLDYSPEYKDYKNLNERDSLVYQNVSMSAASQLTKHTSAAVDFSYDGHDGNNTGDSWEHSASASIDSQLSKMVKTSFGYDYSNSYEQQLRTGDYKEHQTHNASTSISKKFGLQDSMGATFSYAADNYQHSDDDEYKKYEASAFLTYWFSKEIETSLEYTTEKWLDALDSRDETIAGHIKYIRNFNRHLDGFVKYRHYISRGEDGDHVIYHPSVGVDWDITEDSGVSIGFGILFSRWDNDNKDSTKPFLDLDAYKVFNFSPKGSLYITGSSSYEASNDEAASLGFNISYQVGCYLNYKLARRLSSNLFCSYQLQQFEETVNRMDHTVELGGGVTWNPLKWLQVSADATHTNFRTDDASRENYKTNTITVSVRFVPQKPIRPDKVWSRISLDKLLFD